MFIGNGNETEKKSSKWKVIKCQWQFENSEKYYF